MINKVKTVILIIGLFLVIFGADIILKNQQNIKEDNLNVETNIKEENKDEEINEEQQIENDNESKVIEMSSARFEEEVLKSEKIVLIDFYATWCGPCKILSPTIEEIAKENEDIKVVKIDVDKEPDLAIKYGAYSIPTLVVIENGEVKNSMVGVQSKENILLMID